MLKHCEFCGKLFQTDYPSKRFCNESCARKARFTRDESFYFFPHEQDAEPLFSFKCKNCGKEVKIYSKYDQRNTFCCGICAKNFRTRKRKILNAKKHGANIGLSGGMSLGSLARRESRSAKVEKATELKVCPVCGRKFSVTPRRQKYCSLACRQTDLLHKLRFSI